ncbi:tetratricopeptide repeat protein [Streptomyces sp. NPDC050504]|uniref:tetratricopeptide repeat protein n=1 Tax=Streptomyces sp. NPDC050504 TaxID=3365618 RepID=UPI0037B2620B
MGAGELSALRVRLKDALAASGLSVTQLARRAGRSRTVVYQALREGDPPPSAATVAALARALRLPLEELLEELRAAASAAGEDGEGGGAGDGPSRGGGTEPGGAGPLGGGEPGGSGPGGAPGQVTNSVSGTVYGTVVQAGSIGTLISQAPPPPARADVSWPLRIGAVPDLATAFQPRTVLREQIDRAQGAAGTVVLSQVLSGGGGVGKTQLAAALAHRAGRDGTDAVDVVLWADATRLEQLLGTYAEAALLVRAPGAAGKDVEADARAFLNWAATTGRSWLMVLDDVTEPAALRGWWPPTGARGDRDVNREGRASDARGGGVRHRAVITTRLKGADIGGGGRRVLDVSTFAAAESAAFLRERLADADAEHLLDESVDEVGAVLGHLPLALGYAAAWMINEDQPCGAYVAHFRDQEQRLGQVLPADGSGEAYDREIAAALLLSLGAAQRAEPVGLAAPALDLAAFLDPAGHPEDFWRTDAVTGYLARARSVGAASSGPGPVVGRGDGAVDGRGAGDAVLLEPGAAGRRAAEEEADSVGGGGPPVDAATARRAMRLLYRYGLVATRRDDPQRAVRVHALTARAAREALPEEHEGTVVRAVADALLELWPEEDHHDMARAAVLRANTDHLWPLAGDHLWRSDSYRLLYRAGESHWHNGLPSAAATYWEHQAAAAERLLEADHPYALAARANLAASYWSVGRTDEAIALEEHVLADRVRVLGDQHPHTLTTRANLATSYQHAGRVDEAIVLEEHVLADRVRVLGDRHPRTLASRANLAISYRHAGRVDEAIALEEHVLADSEHVFGPGHPDTLTSRANLATSYRTAGRVDEAIALAEQVLADRVRVLGDQHPHTLTTRANLATSYWTAGRREEAVGLLETAVEGSRQVLGDQHPDTVARGKCLRQWREQGQSLP